MPVRWTTYLPGMQCLSAFFSVFFVCVCGCVCVFFSVLFSIFMKQAEQPPR